jgi:ABC-type phosphate/phosphonate transport system substrate-binding protein
MSAFIAALPMYDWPETHDEIDAEWAGIRDRLRAQGVEAPERLARRNADLPAVPGGIRDVAGRLIAPDPASLPPDELDLGTLWRHPRLLFCQSCWGPLEAGLLAHVEIVGQPDYSAFEGGNGEFYSSALVMRAGDSFEAADGLPFDLFRGLRLAFNSPDSMSGLLALRQDLKALGEGLGIFRELVETGSHRASLIAVAQGRADVAAIDCRSWSLFRCFEPNAQVLTPVGWTTPRKGLPYIRSASLPLSEAKIMDRFLAEASAPTSSQAPSTTSKPSNTGAPI